MNPQSFLEQIESKAAGLALEMNKPSPLWLDINVGVGQLSELVERIMVSDESYLIAITGLDPGTETGNLWVIYHMACGAEVINLRVTLPRETPTVPTITHILPSAGIFEQELAEVLGVVIIDPATGNPLYHDHLFLPDDWPAGIFPLRKDFQGVDIPA